MPEFVPVLIAAVLSLIVLLVAFGGSFIFTPGPSVSKASSKTIVLGQDLTVMFIEGQKNVTSLGGEVSQGLFGSNPRETEFTVEKYQDATEGAIKLNVTDSNYYGALIIRVNDETVYTGVPAIGERTIMFDGKLLKSNNTLAIDAESSGWKIWAPTVYLFDSSMSVNYIGRETQSLSFDLTASELKSLSRARLLIFGTRKGNGNLVAKMNDREIFSGFTTVYTDFAIDNLKEGKNVLDLSTEKNTVYNITSVQVVVFY
ncbi:MAG: hypothetical protein V1678_04955 [Candidatus Aenigmatarchaeota archaeon]